LEKKKGEILECHRLEETNSRKIRGLRVWGTHTKKKGTSLRQEKRIKSGGKFLTMIGRERVKQGKAEPKKEVLNTESLHKRMAHRIGKKYPEKIVGGGLVNKEALGVRNICLLGG